MNNIADKITKLIAKAESTTHPEEALAFMAKVHQLLEQHGMSMLDVGTLQTDDPIGETSSSETGKYFASESFMRDVIFKLARYYGCQAIVHRRGNHRWATVIGRESARVTFSLMYPFVKKMIRSEARRLSKDGGDTFAREQRYVADALSYRLSKLYYDTLQETPKGGTGVNALVPVDVIDVMIEAYNATPARQRELKLTLAAMKAAENIPLNMQTAGAKQKRIG